MSWNAYYVLGAILIMVEIVLMCLGLGSWAILFTPILITLYGTLIIFEIKKSKKEE